MRLNALEMAPLNPHAAPLPIPIQIPPARNYLERMTRVFQRGIACLREVDTTIDTMVLNLYQTNPCLGSIAICIYLPTFIRGVDGVLNDNPPLQGAYFSMLPFVIFIATTASYFILRPIESPTSMTE